ncbi:MAG: hypothetical protein GKR92_02760 [Gammaproteobacteria bacterium]|nr:MAG: hypothetical protein GKR92_02760 [Gammaproteobacteria bacterium]
MTEVNITEWLQHNATFVVLSTFLVLAVLESLNPASKFDHFTRTRWANNILFYIIIFALNKFTGPITALLTAYAAEQLNIGLFNHYSFPILFAIAIGVLTIDLMHYATHRMYHHYDSLWKMHKVHHCDFDLDITNAWRFHPFEIILNSIFFIAVISLLGLPPIVLLINYLFVAFMNYIEHSRITLPKFLENKTRWILITPTLHRIHHTVPREDHDNNYGTIFSIWDRLLGTLRIEPSPGNSIENLGLKEYRNIKAISVWRSLWMPFAK